MTTAHELAERDFDVVVYELRELPGGKARSMAARPGVGGRQPLPGEHGFRFFPGFYNHLPDTMTRIPYANQWNGVRDNLVTATEVQMAREHGANELITPASLPTNLADWDKLFVFLDQYEREVAIPDAEKRHFGLLLARLLASCRARRFEQYEHQSWWEFSSAASRTEDFQRYLADGLTRSLVAAQAKEVSARTGGYILLQLLQDMFRFNGQVDRVLRGPTNDLWLNPWLAKLRDLGVDYRFCHRVEELRSDGPHVSGIVGHMVKWTETGPISANSFEDSADYYVCAVPVEVMQPGEYGIAMEGLRGVSDSIARLEGLRYRWMNGIMFYLAEDVPVVHGHSIYIDSALALTSISQRQFWPGVDFPELGDGTVGGILSVDISDWEDGRGRYVAKGKRARECSKEEIAREVWAQLQAALNNDEEILASSNLVDWFLDPSIVFPNPTKATNLEPLMINTKGSWDIRPEAALPEVDNLFLASDYVRTFTDLATMEAANEAARRAVNAILDTADWDRDDRCRLFPLQEPGGPFWVARKADEVIYRLSGGKLEPPSPVAAQDGEVRVSPAAGLTRPLQRE